MGTDFSMMRTLLKANLLCEISVAFDERLGILFSPRRRGMPTCWYVLNVPVSLLRLSVLFFRQGAVVVVVVVFDET